MRLAWNRINTVLLALVLLVLVTALAKGAFGGPLDPPAPPGSTLPQVEPRSPIPPVGWNGTFPITISQAGSYFLTRDISLASAQPEVVLITASDVDLDLNGFMVDGSGFGDGIVASGTLTRVTIRDGSVVRALSVAIKLGSTLQSVLQDLKVQQYAAGTAVTAGEAATVRNLNVWAPVGSGVSLGPVANVEDCIVDGFGNANVGTIGLQVGIHSSVSRCSVAYFNTGINAGPISRISDCVVRFEDTGISVGDTSTVDHCSSDTSATFGIVVGVASRVSDCDVRNGRVGVHAAVGSTVERCTVGSMSGASYAAGIEFAGNGVAENNEVDTVTSQTLGCGIWTGGAGNRIDGNHVINSGVAFCTSGYSSIFRNTLHNNGSAYISGFGDDYGPFAPAASATSPWANVAY